MKCEIEYYETTIESLVSYFVKGFKETGREVINYEQFIDVGSGKVILKLLLERND